jgi:hypothetical protein
MTPTDQPSGSIQIVRIGLPSTFMRAHLADSPVDGEMPKSRGGLPV